MIKELFKHGLIYTLSGFLTRGISFILLPLYTRCLTTADYGRFDYLTLFIGLSMVVVTLEVSQALSRMISESDDLIERRVYSSTTLWFAVATYSVFSMIVILYRAPLSLWLLGSVQFVNVLVAAIASFWINNVMYQILNQLRFELRAKEVNILSIYSGMLGVFFTALFLLKCHLGVQGIFWAQAVTSLFTVLCGLFLTRHSFCFCFSFNKLKQMLAFSVPMVPTSICVVLSLCVDRFFIKEMLSINDVGVYGVGMRVASIASLLMLGFQGATTPLIYKHYKNPETPGQLATIFNSFVAMALILFMVLSSFSSILISILAPGSFAEASYVVPPLVLSILFSNMYIFAPGLHLVKRTKIVAGICILSAILNMILNVLFIPFFGIVGSAISTMFSGCFMFCLYMGFSQHHYYVPHCWPRLLFAACVTMIIVAIEGSSNMGLYFVAGLNVFGIVMILVIQFRVNFRWQLFQIRRYN